MELSTLVISLIAMVSVGTIYISIFGILLWNAPDGADGDWDAHLPDEDELNSCEEG